MAKIGMKYIVAAKISEEPEGQLPTYEAGVKFGRAISSNVTFRRNDSELYADDTLAESDNTITGGDMDMTVAEVQDEVREIVFGDVKEEDGSYHDSSKASPYIGIGYMREQRYKGVSSFHAMWLYKVQLATAEDNAQTKGETTTFQTQRVTGEVMGIPLADGTTRFRSWQEFKTAAEAVAWLNKHANYTETTTAA